MTRTTFRSAVLLFAVLLAIGGWWVWRDGSAGTDRTKALEFAGSQQGTEQSADASVLEEAVVLKTSRELQVDAEAEKSWIDIRLQGAVLGEGLMGQVRDAGGDLLVETAADGNARLGLEPAPSGPLRFTATGYQARVLALPGELFEGPWVVRLEPLLSTTILTVAPDGGPIANVAIRVSRQDARAAARPWASTLDPLNQAVIEGRTDALGRFSFPLAGLAVAELTLASGDSQRVQLAGGEELRIVIEPENASIVFLDAASGVPLAGFVLSVREPLAARQTRARRVTDDQGRILVPAGTRELIAELTDARWTSAECDDNARVTDLGNGYSFRFNDLVAGDLFEIRVECCGVSLRLVDAESGELLTGRVGVRYEMGFDRGEQGTRWSPVPFQQTEADLVRGELLLGCAYLSSSTPHRIRLELPGYETMFLLTSELESNAPTKVLMLQPGDRRVRVRVLFADGSPVRGSFGVLDEASGSRYQKLKSDEQGRLNELPWGGEGLEIFYTSMEPLFETDPPQAAHRGFGGGGPALRSIGRIDREAIEAGDATLRLHVSPVRGSLSIRGLPEGAPVLLALSEEGGRQRASRVTAGVAFFEALAVGSYIVGPAAWLDGLESQNQGPTSDDAIELVLEVEAGETNESRWDPRWQMQSALEGQILCDPGMLAELTLRAWYGTRVGRTTEFGGRLRIYLDDEGRYRIPAGEPRPEVLLVCTANSSFWIQVLQAFDAGQDTRVKLGSMTLEWQGERPEEGVVTVLYWGTEVAFDAEFNERSPHGFALKWNTLGPLRLNAVPTSVRDVRIDVGRDGRRAFPVVIVDGEDTRVPLFRGGGEEVPLGR